jgi:hypothetical protein
MACRGTHAGANVFTLRRKALCARADPAQNSRHDRRVGWEWLRRGKRVVKDERTRSTTAAAADRMIAEIDTAPRAESSSRVGRRTIANRQPS